MNTIRIQIAALAIAGLTLGCRSLQSVEPYELEGSWVASQARFVEIAAPKRNNVDILDLGYQVGMVFDDAGNFVLIITGPGGEAAGASGKIAIDGTDITFVTGTGEGELFVESDQMAIRLTAGLTFNFGDGRDVPARLLLVMDRIAS